MLWPYGTRSTGVGGNLSWRGSELLRAKPAAPPRLRAARSQVRHAAGTPSEPRHHHPHVAATPSPRQAPEFCTILHRFRTQPVRACLSTSSLTRIVSAAAHGPAPSLGRLLATRRRCQPKLSAHPHSAPQAPGHDHSSWSSTWAPFDPRRACALERTVPPVPPMGPALESRRGGSSWPVGAVNLAGTTTAYETCRPELTEPTDRCFPRPAAGWLCPPAFSRTWARFMHVGAATGDVTRRARRSARYGRGSWRACVSHRAATRPRRAEQLQVGAQQLQGCAPPPRGRVGRARAAARAAQSRAACVPTQRIILHHMLLWQRARACRRAHVGARWPPRRSSPAPRAGWLDPRVGPGRRRRAGDRYASPVAPLSTPVFCTVARACL